MHRARSNTSLDERALTEAAKARRWKIHVCPICGLRMPDTSPTSICVGGMSRQHEAAAVKSIEVVPAALPEPPLDEWLNPLAAEKLHRAIGLTKAIAEMRDPEGPEQAEGTRGVAREVVGLLEALAEHRKESGGG